MQCSTFSAAGGLWECHCCLQLWPVLPVKYLPPLQCVRCSVHFVYCSVSVDIVVCNVDIVVCYIQCVHYSVQCTVCRVQYIVYSAYIVVCNVQCAITVCSVQYEVCRVQCPSCRFTVLWVKSLWISTASWFGLGAKMTYNELIGNFRLLFILKHKAHLNNFVHLRST